MPQMANFVDGGQAKAFVEDAKAAPSTAPADAAAGGGVAGIGLSGTLAELQSQLSPFTYTSEWIGKVVVVLALVSAVLAIGGLAYGWYARRKAARRAVALGTGAA
ncbi:hypothetical protein ACVOMV_25020 [Mesorhizobium atlanticum]